MSRFALDHLFMHGHFVTPAALRALNLDATPQHPQPALPVAASRAATVALNLGHKGEQTPLRRRRVAHG